MADLTTLTTIRADCGQCGGVRNCGIRGSFTEKGGDDDYQWITEWRILQCLGCNNVFAQTVHSNSEDIDHVDHPDGSFDTLYTETVEYWPALNRRGYPKWFSEILSIDHGLYVALREVYGALNSDLDVLAAIGMRTAFDVASDSLGVASHLKFEDKLKALVAKSHIGPLDVDRVETLIDAGSASAHRGWRPAKGDIATAIDVLEHFIENTFVEPQRKKELDAKASALKAKVPPKHRKPSSGTS